MEQLLSQRLIDDKMSHSMATAHIFLTYKVKFEQNNFDQTYHRQMPVLDQLRCVCASYKCSTAYDANTGLFGVLVSRRTYDRHQKEDEDAGTTRASVLVLTGTVIIDIMWLISNDFVDHVVFDAVGIP